ncbi:hypothetical protein WMY93_018585 [Mugilogobius chulae]|uniref:Sulfotransferase domain-containing protein n=1 Tax=Mugilogobius chulae TaxID=88201 RepID=A0AAW0NW25_9GOBI
MHAVQNCRSDSSFSRLAQRQRQKHAVYDGPSFQAKSNDIVITGFPRSGHTWVSYISELLCFGLSPENLPAHGLHAKIPTLEINVPLEDGGVHTGVQQANSLLNSPRIFKTHLPVQFLPKSFWEENCKEGVRTKFGINMVLLGEPGTTRSSKEGCTSPGRKRSRSKPPCRSSDPLQQESEPQESESSDRTYRVTLFSRSLGLRRNLQSDPLQQESEPQESESSDRTYRVTLFSRSLGLRRQESEPQESESSDRTYRVTLNSRSLSLRKQNLQSDPLQQESGPQESESSDRTYRVTFYSRSLSLRRNLQSDPLQQESEPQESESSDRTYRVTLYSRSLGLRRESESSDRTYRVTFYSRSLSLRRNLQSDPLQQESEPQESESSDRTYRVTLYSRSLSLRRQESGPQESESSDRTYRVTLYSKSLSLRRNLQSDPLQQESEPQESESSDRTYRVTLYSKSLSLRRQESEPQESESSDRTYRVTFYSRSLSLRRVSLQTEPSDSLQQEESEPQESESSDRTYRVTLYSRSLSLRRQESEPQESESSDRTYRVTFYSRSLSLRRQESEPQESESSTTRVTLYSRSLSLRRVSLQTEPTENRLKPFVRDELFEFKGIWMNHYYTDNWENVQNFQAKPDDIVITGFPRSGSTWTSYIIDLLCFGIPPENLPAPGIYDKVPVLEMNFPLVNGGAFTGVQHASFIRKAPRLFKTHLPAQFLPKSFWEENCKIVYVARNPKDVVVSYYHFDQTLLLHPEPGDWSSYFQRFLQGKVMYGSWFDHVTNWWKQKRLTPTCILSFMKIWTQNEKSIDFAAFLACFVRLRRKTELQPECSLIK